MAVGDSSLPLRFVLRTTATHAVAFIDRGEACFGSRLAPSVGGRRGIFRQAAIDEATGASRSHAVAGYTASFLPQPRELSPVANANANAIADV